MRHVDRVAGRPVFRHGLRVLSRQRGVVVLMTLLIVLGVGVWVLAGSATRAVPVQLRADQRTLVALTEAKQALIGYAVADDDRPGSLPCPDALTNIAGNVPDDGLADVIPVGSSDCPSYIGRLPWRTLGLQDLRDESGERLWYALSSKFRDHATAHPINSDTRADRVVYRQATGNALAPEAVAVIFAPGSTLGTQRRDGVVAPCAAPNASIARRLCAANYLDASGGENNSAKEGPYIAAPRSVAFNDKLGVLTPAELMPLVEQRVGIELRNALIEYRLGSSCQCYPWAATVLGTSLLGQHRGHVPTVSALPQNWGTGKIPNLPAWFIANEWADVIYYTVGKTSLQSGGTACVNCIDPTLSIGTEAGYAALILTPSTGPIGTARTPGNWSQYLEDAENVDKPGFGNDVYVVPTSTSMARDRMFVTPGAAPAQCGMNGRMLADNVPCMTKGGGKKALKPICRLAKENIENAKCNVTCVAAADTLTKQPCGRKVKRASCKTAVTQAKICTP